MPTETQSLEELTVLRALGLKGRGAAEVVAAATGLPPERVEVVLESALATGAVKQVGEAFRLTPEVIEFWRDRPFRLHERLVFEREGEGWTTRRLFP